MIAYKFLGDGGIGPFSRFEWPLPDRRRPGAWVDGAPDPRTCVSGVHACAVGDLPTWLGAELYVAELDGRIERARTKLVAERGRLVGRVEEWNADAAAEFAAACARRARDHAALVLRGCGHLPEADALAEPALRELPSAVFAPSAGARPTTAVAYAADAAACAVAGQAAATAYVAAHAAGHALGSVAGMASERAWQARWLARRLGLSAHL